MDRTESRTDAWAAPSLLTVALMLALAVVGLSMTLPLIVLGLARWGAESAQDAVSRLVQPRAAPLRRIRARHS